MANAIVVYNKKGARGEELSIEDKKKKFAMPQAILEATFVTHIKIPADTRPIVVLLEYHHLPNAVSHLIVPSSVAHQNSLSEAAHNRQQTDKCIY